MKIHCIFEAKDVHGRKRLLGKQRTIDATKYYLMKKLEPVKLVIESRKESTTILDSDFSNGAEPFIYWD